MCGSCSSASWEKEPLSWAQKNKKSDWQLQEEMFCHEHESLSSKKHEEKEKINLHYKTKIMNLYLCNQWNLYDMKLLLWTKRYICKLLDFTCVVARGLVGLDGSWVRYGSIDTKNLSVIAKLMVQLFQFQAELKTGFLSVEFHYLAYTNSFLDRYEPFCFLWFWYEVVSDCTVCWLSFHHLTESVLLRGF